MKQEEIIQYYIQLKKERLFLNSKQNLEKNILLSCALESTLLNFPSFSFGFLAFSLIHFFYLQSLFYLGTSNYVTNHHPFFQEIFSEYQQTISRIVEAVDFCNCDHPAKIFGFYYYLLENGYFSYGKKFEFDSNNYDAIYSYNSNFSIIDGSGVCRHVANHFVDVLKQMGFSASVVGCSLHDFWFDVRQYVDLEELKLKVCHSISLPDLDDKLYFEHLKSFFAYCFGNHIMTGIEWNHKAYWFDASNNCFFVKYNKKNLTFVDLEQIEQSKLPKRVFLVPIRFGLGTIQKLYSNHMDQNFINHLTNLDCERIKEMGDEYRIGFESAMNSKDKLEKLYEANLESYKSIVCKLEQYRKAIDVYEKSLKKSKKIIL